MEKIVTYIFIIIALLLGLDIFDDIFHGSDLTHVLLESGAFVLSAGMLAVLLIKFYNESSLKQEQLTEEIRDIVKERDAWKERSEKYVSGLGKAIEEQFQVWNLSESEKDVGILILKGFSHKEIATLRNTSERTVRQQAASLYGKAGIDNKAHLSAFFLEDLMVFKS